VKKILIIICVVLFVGALIISPLFIKIHVDCRSQYGECPAELMDKLSGVNGKSLFFAKNDLNKILRSDFIVSKFSLQFKLPNFLHVDLLIKKPVFAVKSGISNQFALVDKDGQVLSIGSSTILPTVDITGDLPKIGEKVDADTLFALKLMGGVSEMYQVNEGEIQSNSLLVELPGQIRVIFPLEDADSDLLLGSLRLIYLTIQADGNKNLYKEVDMRYKNPVLR
jgi:hypothetical protein